MTVLFAEINSTMALIGLPRTGVFKSVKNFKVIWINLHRCYFSEMCSSSLDVSYGGPFKGNSLILL